MKKLPRVKVLRRGQKGFVVTLDDALVKEFTTKDAHNNELDAKEFARALARNHKCQYIAGGA